MRTDSPNMDMIETHRTWMSLGFSDNTVRDACELLYRMDRDLIAMQAAVNEPSGGLATALGDELVAWLAKPRHWETHPLPGSRPRRRTSAKQWSNQTRATYRQIVVRFYRWAERNGWIDHDPSIDLISPKIYEPVPKPATDAQVRLIETTAVDPHWLHLLLAAYQGFRPSDVANAERKHFALGTCEVDGILVEMPTVTVRGKGNKPAILPCDQLIWKAVKDLPAGPIARRPRGGRHRTGLVTAQDVTNDTTYYLHHKLRMDITMRSLRAWYATTMLDLYKNPRVVQELMRHSSLNTLQRYAAVGTARQRAALLTLPHFGGRSVTAEDAEQTEDRG